ncbi:hypothetical protein G8C92_24815 [Paenibacillus donghaensis]|uniref:hypothetical protein n=1 Tax=Paenibacillus donghaensis TaxID=414771 RepID=UPI0018837F45|nr:hypothetical protein [Paenibacillus donghaensis]MBE9917242.1 hypothetical protein [Paenibacillus donghaensis]
MEKFKTKIAIVSSLTAVMILAGTASAYAAVPAASKGQATKISAGAKADKKTASPEEQVYNLVTKLHPGEMIAYYIPDKKINLTDRILFSGKGYVLTDYDAYTAKAAQMNAPSLQIPETYPKDYKFKSGVLYLKEPDESSELYKKLDKQLRAEAAKGGKEFYTIPVEDGTGEASGAALTFVKGSVEISLYASHAKPPKPMGGTPVPFSNPDEKTETMVIGGIKCTYTTAPKLKSRLSWTDTSGSVNYSIFADNAKTDVLRFAKAMLEPEAN